jgi:hypothetical protein
MAGGTMMHFMANVDKHLLNQEFHKDNGMCYYCNTLPYKEPQNWYWHLKSQHENTIRLVNLEDRIIYEERTW